MHTSRSSEQEVLVLQGGGALGAYQAGAFEALAESDHEPEWIAGISIGAINAAIIAGNPSERRVQMLRQFWDGVSAGMPGAPWMPGSWARQIFGGFGAAAAMYGGVAGFFVPRIPPAALMPDGSREAMSIYDTAPLAKTLADLVDFDYLNEAGPRLSVGAVEITTGNFAYFDSAEMLIGPEHVLASGALPPGFPPVSIEGRHYWDGGLVSNTPLQFVLERAPSEPLCIFQIDLFSARGVMPGNLSEVAERDKDIRYSSRTRLTTDRFRQLHAISAAACRLTEKVPEALRDDQDLAFLRSVALEAPVTLVHLIHRKEGFETQAKDYEFSRISMTEHWAAGRPDVECTLRHRAWRSRRPPQDGLAVFDLGHRGS